MPGTRHCLTGGRNTLIGKFDEAIQLVEPAFREGLPADSPKRGEPGCGYARSGRREEAEQIAAGSGLNPFNQAAIFACLGDKDRTFEALDRAAVVGPIPIGRKLNSPEFELLGGDPRLAALRKKVGLPE